MADIINNTPNNRVETVGGNDSLSVRIGLQLCFGLQCRFFDEFQLQRDGG